MQSKVDIAHIAVFITACLLFGILNSITVATAPVTIEDILEGIRYNESLLKSQQGTLIVKTNITEAGRQHFARMLQKSNIPGVEQTIAIVKEGVVRYQFEGGRFHYDFETKNREWDLRKDTEQEFREKRELAYDGETVYDLRITLQGIFAILDSTFIASFLPILNPRYWGIDTQGKSLAERIEAINLELIGMEPLEDELCYVIRFKPPIPSDEPSQDIGDFRIWIDPNKGYGLRRIENSSSNSRVIATNRFKEVTKDLWIPYFQEQKEFFIDPDTGEQILISESIRELRDFHINIDIPDDVFRIKFEKGIQVYDARTKEAYIAE